MSVMTITFDDPHVLESFARMKVIPGDNIRIDFTNGLTADIDLLTGKIVQVEGDVIPNQKYQIISISTTELLLLVLPGEEIPCQDH